MGNSGNVIVVFLIYSAAVFILPLFTFFAMEKILKDDFHITGFANRAWSLISAVVVVNLIIMAYAWRAYKEEAEDERTTESVTSKSVMTKSDLNLKKSE